MRYDLLILGQTAEAAAMALGSAAQGLRTAWVATAPVAGPPWAHLDETLFDLPQGAGHSLLSKTGAGNSIGLLRQDWALLQAQAREQVQTACQQRGVALFHGIGAFIEPDRIRVERDQGAALVLAADRFIIATGTQPARPRWMPEELPQVMLAEDLFAVQDLPSSAIVVGAGTTGLRVTRFLQQAGVRTVLIEARQCPALQSTLPAGVKLHSGEEVIGVEQRARRVVAVLESGRTVAAESIVVTVARRGATSQLQLPVALVGTDEQDRIWCDHSLRTWAPHIYAVGDVVGYPAEMAQDQAAQQMLIRELAADPRPAKSIRSTARHVQQGATL